MMKPFRDEPWRRNHITREAKLRDKPTALPTPEPFIRFGNGPWSTLYPEDYTSFITIETEKSIDYTQFHDAVNELFPCYVYWNFNGGIFLAFTKEYKYGFLVDMIKPIIIGLLE